MTYEERREQAEKEVREKLEFVIEAWNNEQVCSFVVPLGKQPHEYRHITAADAIAAYSLAVSQTIALSEAQKRIAELEKYVQHKPECDKSLFSRPEEAFVQDNVSCTCGLATLKGE